MADPQRERLDLALVRRGLVATRARGRDLILRGEVMVAGRRAAKPAAMVDAGAAITLAGGPADYVSRGYLKLAAALAHFGFDAGGRIALDIGASTGGFTEALLEAGAARVYAVENGHGQLHPRLAGNPRVISLDGTDARRLDSGLVPESAGAIVADVSFISLTKALPAAIALASPGAWLIALVKPQFESEPGRVPRDGIVKNDADRALAVQGVTDWIATRSGWRVVGVMPSPIHGGDGNIEFLAGAIRDA